MASIVEAFARNADRTPHKTCLRFEGEEWSCGRAETVAAADWGLRLGERVALFLGNHPDFLAAYLGSRQELASYKKPRQVVFADALPRNALGKVLRYRVREGLIEPEG